jgi:hypothetical protein
MTTSNDRELGEISTNVKHILDMMQEMRNSHEKLAEDVGALKAAKTYLVGAMSTVGASMIGLWFIIQHKIEIIVGAIR